MASADAPRPAKAPATRGDLRLLVDYAKSLDCIHCGLCLHTCPTYRLTGVESSSPRGRIHMMRAVGEGRLTPDAPYGEELDFCLLCRNCESVCPAGVHFGAMMETARDRYRAHAPPSPLARLARWLGFRVVLPRRLALRLAGSALRLVQVTGLLRLAARIAPRRAGALANLPTVPPLRARALLPRRTPVRDGVGDRGAVALLEGCVMPELFARVNRATATSLAALGHEVRIPERGVCCGSLHAHNGDLEGARRLIAELADACAELRDADGRPLPVVTNSAGCGAHMREAFQLFEPDDPRRAPTEALAQRVVDYSELVAPALEEEDRSLPLAPELGSLAWDAPCHLCHGQGVRAQPHAVLARVQGPPVVPLQDEESCCGSAGIYSLLRPADAAAVFESKLEALRRSGAGTVVTANPGCQLQWETGLRSAGETTRVVHLAEIVAAGLHAAR